MLSFVRVPKGVHLDSEHVFLLLYEDLQASSSAHSPAPTRPAIGSLRCSPRDARSIFLSTHTAQKCELLFCLSP
eukprot:1230564-Prymnesium_polylepis.1